MKGHAIILLPWQPVYKHILHSKHNTKKQYLRQSHSHSADSVNTRKGGCMCTHNQNTSMSIPLNRQINITKHDNLFIIESCLNDTEKRKNIYWPVIKIPHFLECPLPRKSSSNFTVLTLPHSFWVHLPTLKCIQVPSHWWPDCHALPYS